MKRFAYAAAALLCTLAVAPRSNPAARSAVAVTPAHVARALESLDGIVRNMQRKTGVPGIAVAVVYADKVVYLKGFGVRKAGTNQRVDANTIFELASVSKPVGASVIAGAVGRGAVKWTDPVQKYLPGFKLADPYVSRTVTIADLYAHRSGLPDHVGDFLEDLGYDRAAILARLAYAPLDPFRITYHYTNFGLTAAAQAVANAEHTSWENLSRTLLYAPLGMSSTSSRYADYARAANHASLHVRVGNTWAAKYTRDADAQSPAGGVSSSVRDMAQWMRFELNNGRYNGKQIVSESALLATRIPQMVSAQPRSPDSRASFYGLGTGVGYDPAGRVRFSHSGGFASGGATAFYLLPSAQLGIVVLTNGEPIGVPESIAETFLDVAEFGSAQEDWLSLFGPLFAALGANPSALAGETRPSKPAPAQSDSAYLGTYQNAFYGPATITERNGRLVMLLGPKPMAFPLTHWTGNVFSFAPTGENGQAVAGVTFTIPSFSGRASSLTIDLYNEAGMGTFTR